MQIVFDQQIFLLQEFGGISRYICSLARELAAISGIESRIVAPFHFNSHLQQVSQSQKIAFRVPRIPKTFSMIRWTSERLAELFITSFKPDIVHETYFGYMASGSDGVPRVLTIYDMIHERFPGMLPNSAETTAQKKAAVLRADHIICISENTRNDLIDTFGVSRDKTSVVYLSFDQFGDLHEPAANLLPELRPFLLYVGSRGGYKNFSLLANAYASSSLLRSQFCILCAGGGRFNDAERLLFASLGLDNQHIRQIPADDRLLAWLYAHTAVFVYPSLYEGFGIPPLEAMSMGCPVVCSDTSSLPEVVGDAAELFDPSSLEALRNSLEKLVLSPSKRAELIAKGYKRCELFNWRKCAEETLEIYRAIT